MNASCQCGAVQFRTPAAKPLAVYHCHCRECRRQSSSAYGTSAVFAVGDMAFLDGIKDKMSVYIRPGERSRTGRDMACYFCTQCGARVMHRYLRATVSEGSRDSLNTTATSGSTSKDGTTDGTNNDNDSCGGGGDGYTRYSSGQPLADQPRPQPCISDLQESDFDGSTFTIKGGLIADLDYATAIHIYTERAVVPIPDGVEHYPGTPPGSP